MLDTPIYKPNVDLGFALRHDIGLLKKKGKISYMQIARFEEDTKNFLATLTNLTNRILLYQVSKSQITWWKTLMHAKSCLIIF